MANPQHAGSLCGPVVFDVPEPVGIVVAHCATGAARQRVPGESFHHLSRLRARLVFQIGCGQSPQWLQEHPTDIPARVYLAGTYLAEKQNKAAIEQYQTVLQQDPKYALALNNLAWLYQQEKDPRALEYAEKANQLTPENPATLDTLGWILVEQGNVTRGLPLLQKANSLAPDAADIHYHLVLGWVKSGDKAKARKELEQLLATGKSFAKIEEARTLLQQL